MALLWLESWQGLSTDTISKKYSIGTVPSRVEIVTSPTGPFQSKCLSLSWSSSSRVYMNMVSCTEVVFGYWARWAQSVADFGTYGQVVLAHTSDGNWGTYGQFQLGMDAGIFKVKNRTGITSYALIITSPKLSFDTWYFIEFQCTKSASGTATLWINGQFIGTYSGDTDYAGSDAIDAIYLQTPGTNEYCYYGPLYVLETAGGGQDARLGPIRVEGKFPAADGTNTDFTISGESAEATHYESVDDPAPDDDTTYVVSSNPTDKDTFDYEDLTQYGTEVYGMQLNLIAKKDDANPRTLKQIFRSAGGEEFETSGELSLALTYSFHYNIWETNPSGEIPWTEADINSGEIGFKLQA